MKRVDILNVVRQLAMSKGSYGSLLEFFTSGSDEAEEVLGILEDANFKDACSLVMFLEDC